MRELASDIIGMLLGLYCDLRVFKYVYDLCLSGACYLHGLGLFAQKAPGIWHMDSSGQEV